MSHLVITTGQTPDLDKVLEGIGDTDALQFLIPEFDSEGRMVLSFEIANRSGASVRSLVSLLSGPDVTVAQCEFGETMDELNMADALYGDMPRRITATTQIEDTPINFGRITDLICMAESSVRRVVLTKANGELQIEVFATSQVPSVTETIRASLMDTGIRIPKESFSSTVHQF